MSKYDDIIHLSRPVIPNHAPMSRDMRAAQFAPYAALTGHRDLIQQNENNNTYQESEIIPTYDDLSFDDSSFSDLPPTENL